MPGMPGVSLLWNEAAPADGDNAGAGAGAIRSLETSVRIGLASEHVWPSASGSGFGQHLLGSAKAFYDVESNVSTSDAGRLLVTSDTTRFFSVGAQGSSLIGGQQVMLFGAGDGLGGFFLGTGRKTYWAVEMGTIISDANGVIQPNFPNSGFSGLPLTWCQPVASSTTPGARAVSVYITGTSGVNFSATCYFTASGVVAPGQPVYYLSLGSRTLLNG